MKTKNFNRFLNFKFIFILGITALLFFAHSLQAVVPAAVTKHPTLTGDKTQTDIPFTTSSDHIYHITGNLNISANQPGNQTGVVFVDGNLNFIQNYTYGTGSTGTVFVVKGDVNISKVMTRIDAVIISEGTICTASEDTSPTCPAGSTDPATTSQLVINGSLIALNPAKPIKFRRALSNNSRPAEKINHQVKYLVILRDLLSDTYQKWAEIP